jgi:hypothetical protein
MSKHTKGPWEVVGNTVYALHESFGRKRNRFWATVYSDPSADELKEEAEANARLIAAAPELLEALKWYVETDEVMNMEGNEFWLEGKARAEAAIRKATEGV